MGDVRGCASVGGGEEEMWEGVVVLCTSFYHRW